jgi:hypothetical protein
MFPTKGTDNDFVIDRTHSSSDFLIDQNSKWNQHRKMPVSRPSSRLSMHLQKLLETEQSSSIDWKTLNQTPSFVQQTFRSRIPVHDMMQSTISSPKFLTKSVDFTCNINEFQTFSSDNNHSYDNSSVDQPKLAEPLSSKIRTDLRFRCESPSLELVPLPTKMNSFEPSNSNFWIHDRKRPFTANDIKSITRSCNENVNEQNAASSRNRRHVVSCVDSKEWKDPIVKVSCWEARLALVKWLSGNFCNLFYNTRVNIEATDLELDALIQATGNSVVHTLQVLIYLNSHVQKDECFDENSHQRAPGIDNSQSKTEKKIHTKSNLLRKSPINKNLSTISSQNNSQSSANLCSYGSSNTKDRIPSFQNMQQLIDTASEYWQGIRHNRRNKLISFLQSKECKIFNAKEGVRSPITAFDEMIELAVFLSVKLKSCMHLKQKSQVFVDDSNEQTLLGICLTSIASNKYIMPCPIDCIITWIRELQSDNVRVKNLKELFQILELKTNEQLRSTTILNNAGQAND